MSPLVTIRMLFARACVLALSLLLAAPALARTDRRAVVGAVADTGGQTGPVIPEPSSVLLFLAGVAVVGYGVHRRRKRSD